MAQTRFGIVITPVADGIDEVLAFTDAAESLGLDLVAVQDHPYQPGHLDSMTLLTYLAARTERLTFFPDVANIALRPPAMLAKAVASLDVLSGGRIDLGIGAGGFPEAVAGMGGPRRSPAENVEATEEALLLIRAAWDTRQPIAYEGKHHHVYGYEPGPAPAHEIGLWVGAQRKRMLQLIGRHATGWVSPLNVYVDPREVLAKQQLIDGAALGADRDPAEIRRIYNVLGTIDNAVGATPIDSHGLNGSVEKWATTLADWVTRLRFDTFIFWPAVPSLDQVRLFATEVVPATKALLAG